MKNKTIYGNDAFVAIMGKTIASSVRSYNSVEITFTDKSFINIEITTDYFGCNINHGDDYCYCSAPSVNIEPYFAVDKT